MYLSTEHARPEAVGRVRAVDLGLRVDTGVVRVDRHPGFGVWPGEAAVRGRGPLDGGAGVVARFLLVFLAGDCLGFRVELTVAEESVPVVETVDILIFFHTPGWRHVSHAYLLSLIYEGSTRMQGQSCGQHLG